jgi:cobalt-zinc-cadmium resistance protein CzcA
MIWAILNFVTRHRFAVAGVSALIAVIGLWSFASLQIDAIPDITGVQVQINTQVPALAPRRSSGLSPCRSSAPWVASPA